MASYNKIDRAHQMYREGRYDEALGFYTEALSFAKTNPQRIALHSNRAACYLKLQFFNKAAEECTSVLELDQNHTGALMLRAQTLVTLKEYRSALFDVNRLIELNPSSEVYQNLEARLRTQLSLAPIPECEVELEEEEEDENVEPPLQEHEVEQEINEDEAEQISNELKEKPSVNKEVAVQVSTRTVQKSEPEVDRTNSISEALAFEIPIKKVTPELGKNNPTTKAAVLQAPSKKELPEKNPKGWQSIPKPKGHTALDYARWDSVEDDSSEDDEDSDDDEDDRPQYRFRLKTTSVRSVK